MKPRTVVLTALALVCFAGNSLLCRGALAAREIDAASFTAVRVVSGAAVLVLLGARRSRGGRPAWSWLSAFALFLYAAPFSFAYLRLGAALGALVLFGVVQVTMIAWGASRGERLPGSAWIGVVIALAGLGVLAAPGLAAPHPIGMLSMAVAGVGWGMYSLRGRKRTGDPVVTTAANFVLCVPMAIVLVIAAFLARAVHASPRGLALAACSGGLASGVGYSMWYGALGGLSAAQAAVVQLLVPILATAGAIVLLHEHPTLRFGVAAAAVLGGVALALARRAPTHGAAPSRRAK
jgi:drug/metabolite transporter (DMT)-like permease